MTFTAGLDVGGTCVKRAIVDEQARLHFSDQRPTESERGMDFVIESLQEDIRFLHAKQPDIIGVGIGFPSVVDVEHSIVHIPPNMHGWSAVDLWKRLRSGLNLKQDSGAEHRYKNISDAQDAETTRLPIFIDNDANVAALAELRAGAASGLRSFLYITLGTGVGGAIILHGQILRGERGGAGEIGHVVISRRDDDPEVEALIDHRPFRRGVLERYCGRSAMIHRARQLLLTQPHSLLTDYGDALDVHHISQAADRGDTVAVEVLQQVAEDLSLGIASAVNLLDLRTVVIGGGISRVSQIFFDAVQKRVKSHVLPSLEGDITILRAHFSSTAGVIGAAMLAQPGM